MASDTIKNSSPSQIPPTIPAASASHFGANPDEDPTEQSPHKRPQFSIRARLVLLFLVLFVVSAAVSLTAMFMLSMINYRVQYLSLADRISNEIQHARRIEKNYFLYASDLSEITDHIAGADALLQQASIELGRVVGRKEIDTIRGDLHEYSLIAGQLMAREHDTAFRASNEFALDAQALRNFGSRMLDVSLDISKKERQRISSTVLRAKWIHIILLVVLLALSIYIVLNISRHLITRLNRLMEATRRFAAGNFTPITPTRTYKDEFSQLTIVFNHMMFELEKRQSLLEESHKLRAIGSLTAGIAHELNNPLNNIILTSEMLKVGFKELSDEECDDMINDLVIQGEWARQVVKNLLDFARESETKPEFLYVNVLITETIQLVKNQSKLGKVRIDVAPEENLPPICGDRKLLIQVFLNLCINAIDAMPSGGTLTITVREEKQIGFLAVLVSDTGCGIPEHIIKSIFNPFFTRKPTGRGTGLGLSVSRGLIEKHGGHIDAQSKVGVGSTFTVYLPVVSIPADLKDKRMSGAV